MIRRGCIRGLMALALLCGAALAQAQTYTLRGYTDPLERVSENRAVRFVLEISGSQLAKVSAPRLSGLVNLEVLNGPSQSNHSRWVNGQSSATMKLTWVLMPLAPGPAEIPALQVQVGNETRATEPIRLSVEKSQSRTQPGGSGGAGSTSRPQAREDVFLEAELASKTAWVGEPVPLTLTLYTIPQISGFALRKRPDFANFWVETLEDSMDGYRARVGGKVYQAFPVERLILIPPSPGDFELRPYIAQMQVRMARERRRSFFDFGRSETLVAKSEPLRLKVRQLPTAGRPQDFSGAVGSYSLTVSLDRSESLVNDAVALKATVEGQGSLRSVTAPFLGVNSDLKVFDAQIKESVLQTVEGKVLSRKTWEWIVVPLTPGDLRMPELSFSYFDPAREQYATANGGELMLAVERGEQLPELMSSRAAITALRQDLQFIKPRRGELNEGPRRAHEGGLFLTLLLLPIGLAPLLVVISRQRARLQRDLGLARSRRARSRARKSFRTARGQIEQLEAATFHEQVARTLVEYVADRFDRSAAGLTYDVAEELLAARGVPAELRRRVRTCLETCDFARFVPASARVERRTEVLDDALKIVEELERAL